MSTMRFLIVEDDKQWQAVLAETLRLWDKQSQIDIADSYQAAIRHIRNDSYDLVTVDLRLRNEPSGASGTEQEGMLLLPPLRDPQYRQNQCGLIVLTGTGHPPLMRTAFRDYKVDDFLDKLTFEDNDFLQKVREVMRSVRLRRAQARTQARYHLRIIYDQKHLIGCELNGPNQIMTPYSATPVPCDFIDLTRRANKLNTTIQYESPEEWRKEARSIGEQIYRDLAKDQHIVGALTMARALANRDGNELWLQFDSLANGLGVPFELLCDSDDFLCMANILTRHLLHSNNRPEHRALPFYSFIERLVQQQQSLKILLVDAGGEKGLPGARDEARQLKPLIEHDLAQLGIPTDVVLLEGAQATRDRVSQELQTGRYHIFHYAGHGTRDESLPEQSGLVFDDNGDPSVLTAADINNLLLRNSNIQLVYLSSCLGAHSAADREHGDFYGLLDAIARANVPAVLGYRWSVGDQMAKSMAQQFYTALWESFSPGEALLAARQAVARGPAGRNNETWASPVLLTQSS